MSEARGLQEVLGERLRSRREELGLRQDDVASAARRVGLPWSRSVIAQVEAGRRELPLPEVFVLAVILDMNLRALLGAGRLALAPALVVDAQDLIARLEGSEDQADDIVISSAPKDYVSPEGERRLRRSIARLRRLASIDPAAEAAAGEAEQKAARKLGRPVTPIDVSRQAFQLWGRSLSEERDRRVRHDAPAEAKPATLRALRGHVTRRLVDEIAASFANEVRRRTKGGSK